MNILIIAAVLPVALLCGYIYKKDPNKEPAGLLAKLFIFGFFSSIPIVILELILNNFFPTKGLYDFFKMFINVFIAIGLVEEGFKWIISMLLGYRNKEFDEIYDIIVYTVFVSLGFACIENILYVLSNGLGNAILRAITSIPGHTCFAVIMGYFFAKAKLNEMNKNSSLKSRNMILSILAPTIAHTFYDALIFHTVDTNDLSFLCLFAVGDIAMVIVCFLVVNKISKMQVNLNTVVTTGIIKLDDCGYIMPNQEVNNVPVITSTIPSDNNVEEVSEPSPIKYCPVCGSPSNGGNFCGSCGYKLK